MGHWSDIPVDLLNIIEERVVLYVDKVRFRCVCASWNSHLPNIKMPNQARQLPWLLHAATQDSEEASHGLFDPLASKVHNLDLLPEAEGMLFKGSSHGWVVTIKETSGQMYLINPLTRTQIQLPPRRKFPDVKNYRCDKVGAEYCLEVENRPAVYFTDPDHVNKYLLDKAVLSSPPSPSRKDCVVVAIYGGIGRLAYCRCDDKKWTFLFGKREKLTDIIFYNNKLHALSCQGLLFVFDDICPNPKVTKMAGPRPGGVVYSPYLVESCDGGLMMVERDLHLRTFKVYKLDPGSWSWFEAKNIGDDMLFLGWNVSLSISCRHFPGYKGNRIYFTDDNTTLQLRMDEEGANIGVFNLEDGTVQSLPGYKYDPMLLWPPPIWVTIYPDFTPSSSFYI